MIVPETKSIYIQSRHELGREWECSGCYDPATASGSVTWHPLSTADEHYEYLIYDSSARGTEGGTMMGIYFEDTFPQGEDLVGNMTYSYFNEVNLYKAAPQHGGDIGYLSAIPIEVVQIFADAESAGAKELSLGVLEIGANQGRTYYEGLGGRGYPVTVQKGDKIVLRPIWIDGDDLVTQNPEAARAGHQELAVLPARGNLPTSVCLNWIPEGPGTDGYSECQNTGFQFGCGWITNKDLCNVMGCNWVTYPPSAPTPPHCGDSPGEDWELGNYEEWNKRFYLNVTIDIVETKMVERKVD